MRHHRSSALLATGVLVAAGADLMGGASRTEPDTSAERVIDTLLDRLTLERKVRLVSGADSLSTRAESDAGRVALAGRPAEVSTNEVLSTWKLP